MWISKSKLDNLTDENSVLKKKIEKLKVIEKATEEVVRDGTSELHFVGGDLCLISTHLYKGFVDKYVMLQAKNKDLEAELKKYKKLYADELQKRLELAEKVREMEDK